MIIVPVSTWLNIYQRRTLKAIIRPRAIMVVGSSHGIIRLYSSMPAESLFLCFWM